MPDFDLDDVERCARAATPGPWFFCDFREVSSKPSFRDISVSCDWPAYIGIASMGNGMTATQDEACANARHIAAVNPKSILAIIAAYRRQAERIRALESNSADLAEIMASISGERDEAIARAKMMERDIRIATQVAIDMRPNPIDSSREAIIAAVEEWVNRIGGEATVDDIASAVLAAAVNAGWLARDATASPATGGDVGS